MSEGVKEGGMQAYLFVFSRLGRKEALLVYSHSCKLLRTLNSQGLCIPATARHGKAGQDKAGHGRLLRVALSGMLACSC